MGEDATDYFVRTPGGLRKSVLFDEKEHRVVGRANRVSPRMRELALDGIPIPSLLVEQGGRHAAKPVPGHFRAAPTEPPQAPLTVFSLMHRSRLRAPGKT